MKLRILSQCGLSISFEIFGLGCPLILVDKAVAWGRVLNKIGTRKNFGVACVTNQPLVSVVIPMKNEEDVVVVLFERLLTVVVGQEETYRFELVFVDDGSSDGTYREMVGLHFRFPQFVTVVKLTRNFGLESAIRAGISISSGDLLLTMDGDLQDPPELIPDFLTAYEEGFEIVSGVRIRRPRERLSKLLAAKTFYRVFSAVSGNSQDYADVANFRLFGPRALEGLASLVEADGSLRAQVGFLGFSSARIPYTRSPRTVGSTKFSFVAQMAFAEQVLVSSSARPLRLVPAILLGAIVFGTLFLFIHSFMAAPVGHVALAVFIFAIQLGVLAALSILSAYMAWIHKQVQGRPRFIVQEVLSFSGSGEEI